MSWPHYHLLPSSLSLLTLPPPQGPSNGATSTDELPPSNWMDKMGIAKPISPTPPTPNLKIIQEGGDTKRVEALAAILNSGPASSETSHTFESLVVKLGCPF